MGSIIGGQWASVGSTVVTAAIYYWIYWLVHQVKVLRSQIKASPESLAHGYTSTGAPLRLFYACFFYTGLWESRRNEGIPFVRDEGRP